MKFNPVAILIMGLVFLYQTLNAQKFEAEEATLVGGAKAVTDASASGGFYVAQEEGHLTFDINLDEKAFYNIYVHAASPYGKKTNTFSINNARVDFTLSQNTEFISQKVVSSLKLTEGNHTVQILNSWGWIQIDYIEFEIVNPSERFDINETLVTPNPTENTAKLYQFLYDNSKYNPLDLWKKMFAHDYVLTLDEMPDLKSYTTPAGTWRSELYPENWQPGFTDEKGRFLHDFSYAGYHQGEKEIPDIQDNIVDVTQPPYNADNTGETYATSAIQQALDAIGQAGGGVVYLPAGTYKVNPGTSETAIRIQYNNTVLRGAGTDSTFIFNDATFMRHKNIIWMMGDWCTWSNPTGTTVKLSSDLLYPSRVIPVGSTSGFNAGDEIILRSGETEAFIEEHGMAGLWNDWSSRVMFHRTIDSINVEKKLIYIDSPTRYFMKLRDNARIYHAKEHISESGIENLSIGNRQNDKSGWDEEDYSTEGNGAYDVHASHAILLKYAQNCWVKNVNTYKPETNTGDFHLLSNSLLLDQCRGVTVDSCFFQKPQYEGGGGNGYMFTLQSNDCLIKNSRANHSRHNYDFKFPHSNGNVIHNCIGENSKYSSDFHMYLSMANLFDVTTVDKDYLESAFRPWGGSVIHGYSSTQSVFYNTTGLNYHPGRDYIVESRQLGYGYIIGTSGSADKVKLDPVEGTTNGYAYNTAPRDWAEGIGKGDELIPQSLYLDQLERRQNRTELGSYSVNIVVKDSVTSEPLAGCQVKIFDKVATTDETGTAHFEDAHSLLSISIEKEYYSGIQNRQLTIFSDTILTFSLIPPKYEVKLIVQDENTGETFSGARVTLGSSVEVTNDIGEVLFDLYGGEYEYLVEKNSYKNQNGIITVSSDTTINFLLSRTNAYIKFWLKEGTAPVNNATVVLNSDTLITTNLGLATFRDLPVNENYSYSLYKEGYNKQTGSLYLERDTTIILQMESDPTGIIQYDMEGQIKIWPNPVTNELNFRIPKKYQISQVQIINSSGIIIKILSDNDLENTSVNLSGISEGIYYLRIVSKEIQPHQRKFIKNF